ncbi:MAG TPA: aminotransferase class IV, partial [Terracidiphilus sp.]|nr:aminotransferase class IV [Terracidiphilus sp.]
QHSALRDSAIRHATKEFESARRVRLLLDHAGAVRIESEALAEARGEILRVCLAAERTDARDRFLFHKTTHRPLYAREFTRAAEEGFADVLFLNRDGEVTEGAISNVFVEKAGRWFTPPVACGLLAGVYRRHLLETRPEIEERVLGVEDLRAADAIYLANAVRGLRRTRVQWN